MRHAALLVFACVVTGEVARGAMHADIVMHGVIMGATWHFWP